MVEKNKILGQKRNEAIKELVVTHLSRIQTIPSLQSKSAPTLFPDKKLNPSDRAVIQELDNNIRGIEKEIIKLRDINLPA